MSRWNGRTLPLIMIVGMMIADFGYAWSVDTLRRYGLGPASDQENEPAPSRVDRRRKDPFNPERIPEPTLPRFGVPEQGPPAPRVTNGRPRPLPPLERRDEAPELSLPPPPVVPPRRQPQRVGDSSCLSCHSGFDHAPKRGHLTLMSRAPRFRDQKAPNAVDDRVMTRTGCESCHGPGSFHVESRSTDHIFGFSSASASEVNRVCMECHYMNRSIDQEAWRFSRHAAGRLSCLDCHSEHRVEASPMLKKRPNELCMSCHQDVTAALSQRSRHPVKHESFDPFACSLQSSKLRCVDCHDPHRRRDEGRRIGMTGSQGCVECHPRQRGPFAYEHRVTLDPRRSCLECHQPHGSPVPRLLKTRGRALCMSCHGDRAAHNPTRTCWTAGCHADVHGSNHDPLLRR